MPDLHLSIEAINLSFDLSHALIFVFLWSRRR
jgi:hypothetical protein